MEKQLHVKHIIEVEKAEQTPLRVPVRPAHRWLSGVHISYTGAVWVCTFCCCRSWCCVLLVGHRLVKGCRLTSWLQDSSFCFLLRWSSPFFFPPVLPSLGRASRCRTALSAKDRGFLRGDVAGSPSCGHWQPPVHMSASSRRCGAGIVGLGLKGLGPDVGCHGEWPWLLSHTLSPKAFLLSFLTLLPFGIVHFPFWL